MTEAQKTGIENSMTLMPEMKCASVGITTFAMKKAIVARIKITTIARIKFWLLITRIEK